MKKFIATLMALTLSVTILSSCGKDEPVNELPTEETVYTEEIKLNDVEAGSEADIKIREVVGEYLDNFIACDFEKIEASLHEDDKWLFNFNSEDQMAFYKTIFPRVSYKFDYIKEREGVYGIMTTITSPNMADVYGTVITEYLDSNIAGDEETRSNIVNNNTQRMLELIASDEVSKRENMLFIYVEYINGEYIPRCDAYLANELTGGAPEASDEISTTINESYDALSE